MLAVEKIKDKETGGTPTLDKPLCFDYKQRIRFYNRWFKCIKTINMKYRYDNIDNWLCYKSWSDKQKIDELLRIDFTYMQI